MSSRDEKLPFLEHLRELRKRVIWIALIWVLGMACTFPLAEDIFHFLANPVLPYLQAHQSQFVTLGLMEGWNVYMKTAIVGGLFFSAPFWLYHVWAFLAPALAKKERRTIIISTFFSLLLFLLGAAFCYYMMMPVGFQFLMAMVGPNIVVMPQMQSYLTLALWLIFAFGLVFQLPLLLIYLVRWGVVSLETLKQSRRYMIVGAFVVGAVLTPPDPVSQICLSLPLIALFELSLFVARFCQPNLSQQQS